MRTKMHCAVMTLVNRDDLCVGEDPQRLLGNSRHVAADYQGSLTKIGGAKNSFDR